MGAISGWCGGWWRPVQGSKSSSAPSALKVHWGKLDAEKLVKDRPPAGKEHRKPENYYKDVLKGACLVADECSRDVIFE